MRKKTLISSHYIRDLLRIALWVDHIQSLGLSGEALKVDQVEGKLIANWHSLHTNFCLKSRALLDSDCARIPHHSKFPDDPDVSMYLPMRPWMHQFSTTNPAPTNCYWSKQVLSNLQLDIWYADLSLFPTWVPMSVVWDLIFQMDRAK